MKANEVRIGNYFEIDGATYKVDAIFAQGNMFRGEMVAPAKGMSTNGGGKCGIPLTEEWLLRMGSEKISDTEFAYGIFRLLWKSGYQYWYVIDRDALYYFTKIEYVHEWQNFIFVMNGTELEIKEQ